MRKKILGLHTNILKHLKHQHNLLNTHINPIFNSKFAINSLYVVGTGVTLGIGYQYMNSIKKLESSNPETNIEHIIVTDNKTNPETNSCVKKNSSSIYIDSKSIMYKLAIEHKNHIEELIELQKKSIDLQKELKELIIDKTTNN